MVDMAAMPDLPQIPAGGSEAAAILLMLLEEGEAAEILGRLDPEEVKQLGGAMFAVADVSEGQVNGVLDQFIVRARERTTIGFEADGQIRGMMERALGSERADKVLANITPAERFGSLEALKWMDAPAIAGIVGHEHPQVAALVLAHLDPVMASDVLQMLEDEVQAEIVYRIATLRPVSAEAVVELEAVLLGQVTRSTGGTTSQRGGPTEAAKIINNTRSVAEQRIIKSLSRRDRNLARVIEEEMFVFENLMDLDEKGLGTLMRAVENDVLVVALKGADAKIRGRMLGCMSSRAAQSIMDEMADRGPTRLAEVQEAQRAILAVARKLSDSGAIMLGGKGEDFV